MLVRTSGTVRATLALNLAPMRVLIVEDEAKMARLIRQGLRSEGIAADVAAKGEEALEMARATPPYDAMILDLMLPGIDGFEVCRRLREQEVWTPVLILTARDAIRSPTEIRMR